MRAKCLPGFVVAIAMIALGSFVTYAEEPAPGVGELVPVTDPNDAPFAVMWGDRVPGPMDVSLEPPPDLVPMSQQAPEFNVIPAASDTGAFGQFGSSGGAFLSPRSTGAVSDLQQAKRSLKQLIRELG